jgi:uncharacterized Ntn-hydrolase superfamily protein
MTKKLLENDIVATYSIVGFDPATGELGVAVQSKFLSVGSVVPWAKANVGAIATQAGANTTFGPKGLQLLQEGFHPDEVVEILLKYDEERDTRQFAIIDAKGNIAAYTGKDCLDWAGHLIGENCSAQGNILVSSETVKALVESFESSTGSLAERLIQALEDGQNAGGDSRGKQSAALYVVKENGGYRGYNDRMLDLRVDDHPEPIQELKRIYDLHQLYFPKSADDSLVSIEGERLAELQELLKVQGMLPEGAEHEYTDEMKKALKAVFSKENFEEKWREDGLIDANVLSYLKKQAAKQEVSS